MSEQPNFTKRFTKAMNALRKEIAGLEPGDEPNEAIVVCHEMQARLLSYAARPARPAQPARAKAAANG